ncbi:MAG: MFS transporter [Bacteroidota bacterium]
MTIRQLLQTHPRYLTFGFLHYFFSAPGQTFFISLFVAAMTERMGWAEGTFAGLYSAVTLVAAFTLPIIGAQIDRLKVRYVSTATALAIILGCVTLGLTTNFYLLAAALFVVRLGGQGVLPLIGSTTIGRYFTVGRGKALSAAIIGGSVAEVVLPPGVVLLLGQLGYATVWLAAAAVVAAVFIPAVWWLIRRYDKFQRADTVAAEQKTGLEIASWTRGQVLRDRRFWLLFPAFILIPFLFTGLVFNQAVLAESRGYTAAWMAVGLSTYGFVRVLLLLSAGSLTDRYGAARLLRFTYLPVLLGLATLLVADTRMAVPLFFGLMGASAGVESVLWPALWAERYGPRFLGSIKSTVRFLVVLASSAAPVAFSFGLRLGVETWLSIILGYGGLALVLVWLEFRARPQVRREVG